MSDKELGHALLDRFTAGVEKGEWRVIALGSGRAFEGAASRIALDLGVDDPEKLVLLVALAGGADT